MDELILKTVDGGVVIRIKARPGARANGFRGVHDGQLRVSVVQVAEGGKANKSIIALLSSKLGISKSCLQIVSGQSFPEKKVLIKGITEHDLKHLLGL